MLPRRPARVTKVVGLAMGQTETAVKRVTMIIERTILPGVLVLTPRRFGDSRGFFSESWNKKTLLAEGITTDFVQDNHSLSKTAGTLRGLHFQAPPHAQTKLVRCGRGRLFDVAVDIRDGAPTYGTWIGVELSFENGKQLLVPEGFLHGFMTLEPMTEVIYKCSTYYAPDAEAAVLWSSLDINWPSDFLPLLSEKDAEARKFADFESPFRWETVA